MEPIRCIIVDDEKLSRERMAILLQKFEEVRIIGIEEDPLAAIENIIGKKPEIVFLDVEMPGKSGFEVVKEVRERGGNPFFIFVTAFNQYAVKAIKTAAFDYLVKPVDIDELNQTFQRFKAEFRMIPSGPAGKSVLYDDVNLSPREIEIIRHIAQCESSQEIADKLFISKNTVDTHRRNILEKTGLRNSKEVMLYAIKMKLV